MADFYIPDDIWSYIFTFIPLPKVEFNKIGFYIINNEIVRITKLLNALYGVLYIFIRMIFILFLHNM